MNAKKKPEEKRFGWIKYWYRIIADSDLYRYLMGCLKIKSDHLQPMKSLTDCHQVQAAVRKWKFLPPSIPKRKFLPPDIPKRKLLPPSIHGT